MRTLWAPWRAQYIYCAAGGKADSGPKHCLFCRLWREKDDPANLILCRGRHAFVVMNRYPYNNGHLMVAPVRHCATPETLTAAEGAELLKLLKRSMAVLRRAYKPDGFNVGANIGRVAGAGVAGHVHLHVVPRWNGDTNYMPLLAETKVVSEHLEDTYAKLSALFSSSAKCRVQSARRKVRSTKRRTSQ
jgi:ATP adenylyltransferase